MLSQEQVDFYHANGYLGVDGVLSGEEVAELRRVTDAFVEASREVTETDKVFDLEPGHTPENPQLRRLIDPSRQHDVYARACATKGSWTSSRSSSAPASGRMETNST